MDDNKVIIFTEYVELKKEVEKLRSELHLLMSEQDELIYVVCKNIEMTYMLMLGHLEYKAYELNCLVLRLKRKVELIQAKKNRQEEIVISDIENILDKEFEAYLEQLNEKMNKVNSALTRSKLSLMKEEESKELKKLYRLIVKAIHPDINPNITKAQLELFYNALAAYKNADLYTLRIISVMITEPELEGGGGTEVLFKERKRLRELVTVAREKIEKIKSEYPYTLQSLINDEEKIKKKKEEIEVIISQSSETVELYKARIAKMLR